MTTAFAFKIFLELVAVLAFLYGLYHEEKLVALEDRLFAALRGNRKTATATKRTTGSKKSVAKPTLSEEEIFAAREQRAMEAAAARKAAARMKAGQQEHRAEIKAFPGSSAKNHHVA